MNIVLPTAENIRYASRLLREGVLVGMPTETVYGIAASALDPDAVRRIFTVKKRPADNPLIVHIRSIEVLSEVAREIPDSALRLAERFWPGPLTVVLPKHGRIGDEVTGGLDTVAVRVPAHPVALALLESSGPISAPSANSFMSLSPTTAEDIEPEIGDNLGVILDGGPCVVGVESTVVDCTGRTPRLLRPGGVDRLSIEAALGAPLIAPPNGTRMSPGMYPKHYSPTTPLRIVERLEDGEAGITFALPTSERQVRLPRDPRAYASALYAVLHRLDRSGYETISVEAPPIEPQWEAVWDRLRKASGSTERE